MTSHQWTELIIGTLMALRMGQLWLVKYLKTKQKKEYNCFWSAHSQLHETLTELRIMTNCARVHLIQFHNGEYFLDGVSMKKLSLTHESLNKGTSGEGDKLQGILISRFITLIQKLLTGNVSLTIVREMDECYFKQFLSSGSTLAYIAVPLMQRGMVVGYIMCQWCNWEKIDQINDQEVKSIIETAKDNVEVLLSQQLHRKERRS